MDIRTAIISTICSASFLCGCALEESKPNDTESSVQYYLYEDEPGPLYWEAEKQTDLGNLEQARELFRQSCESGIGGSCAVLAILFQSGEGGEADNEQACQLFQKSCTMGFAQACFVVAGIFEGDLCGPPDLAHAKALYTIACNTGLLEACVDLAEFYERGIGGKVDLEKARNLYSEACFGQERDGCTHYARILLSGMGDEADIKTAIKLIEQGCADSDAKSCYLLAKTQASADGMLEKVTDYYAIARQGFESVCVNSDETDTIGPCFDYYYMVARGEGGVKDVKRAKNFFKKTCSEGHQQSCDELSVLGKTNELNYPKQGVRNNNKLGH